MRLRVEGLRLFKSRQRVVVGPSRDLIVTGTSGPKIEALEALGLQVTMRIPFQDLDIGPEPEPGHENIFHFGTYQDREVVVSSGRMHLYNGGEALRAWLGACLAAMGDGERIISLSAVGGNGPEAREEMVIMPRRVRCGEVATNAWSSGEFPDTESPLGIKIDLAGHDRDDIFELAALEAGLTQKTRQRHHFVPGRTLVTGTDRKDAWDVYGCLTSGMSLIPVLQAVNFENRIRSPKNAIRVMPVLFIVDTGSHIDPDEFGKMIERNAPKLATMICCMLNQTW